MDELERIASDRSFIHSFIHSFYHSFIHHSSDDMNTFIRVEYEKAAGHEVHLQLPRIYKYTISTKWLLWGWRKRFT